MILNLCRLVWWCPRGCCLWIPPRVSGDIERLPATPLGVLPQSVASGVFTSPFADPLVAFGERVHVLLSGWTSFISSDSASVVLLSASV